MHAAEGDDLIRRRAAEEPVADVGHQGQVVGVAATSLAPVIPGNTAFVNNGVGSGFEAEVYNPAVDEWTTIPWIYDDYYRSYLVPLEKYGLEIPHDLVEEAWNRIWNKGYIHETAQFFATGWWANYWRIDALLFWT